MIKLIRSSLIAVALAGSSLAMTAPVGAETIGVHVGSLGISVGNAHYYDSQHRRRSYSYPSDYKAYHHAQGWYRNHPRWNDASNHDYYRN